MVAGLKELVANYDFLAVDELSFVFNSRVEIEEDRQIDFLLRIEHLILEAEALDLIKVEGGVLWHDLVDRYPDDWRICLIIGLVEGEGCFACVDDDVVLLGLEHPGQVLVDFREELYFVFALDSH